MKTGEFLLGNYRLEREEKGWRLSLKALNGAALHLYMPDDPERWISDVHALHLATFVRNAAEKRTWQDEGMEGL